MRITQRTGRGTYVSIGCGGLLLLLVLVLGLIGWAVNAAQGHAATRTAPAGYSVHVVPVTQDYTDGCVPAVSSMLLSTLGLNVPQDVLASAMNTYANHGTNGADATKVLDAYLSTWHMNLVSLSGLTAAQLGQTIRSQLRAGHPVMLSVWAKRLPWRRTDTVIYTHEILVTGIRGQTVAVDDPEVRALHGGVHDLPVGVLNQAVIAVGVVARDSGALS